MRPRDCKPRVLALVILPCLLLGAIWASTPIEKRDNWDLASDGVCYTAMAERTAATADLALTAPFCWRVLTPFLASLLPWATTTNFLVLAFFSNWLSLALLYGILRRSGLSHRSSLLGVLLYAGVFWAIKFSFYSASYIDFQTQTFLLAILYLMLAERYWAIPLVLTLGVLQKESILFLAPVVYVYYAQRHGWLKPRSLLYLLALSLPALAALGAVQALIRPVNHYSSLEHFLKNVYRMRRLGFWPRFGLAAFSGLGILPALLLYWIRDLGRFLRAAPHWALLVLMGILSLFGGVDKARLFLYLLPPLIVFVVGMLERLLDSPSPATWAWLAITLLVHFYLGYHLTPMSTFDEYLNRMVPEYATGSLLPSAARIALFLALWAAATIAMSRERGLGLRRDRRSQPI